MFFIVFIIPKNFDNALTEFVQTLPMLRQLYEEHAPLSDFRKNLLVLSNMNEIDERDDVMTLL